MSFDQLKSWNKELFQINNINVQNMVKLDDYNEKINDQNVENLRPQIQRTLKNRKTTVFTVFLIIYDWINFRDQVHQFKKEKHLKKSLKEKKIKYQVEYLLNWVCLFIIHNISGIEKSKTQSIPSNDVNIKSRYPRVSLAAQKLVNLQYEKKVIDIPIDNLNEVTPDSPHYLFYQMIKYILI